MLFTTMMHMGASIKGYGLAWMDDCLSENR